MSLQKLCQCDVVTISKEANIQEAAELMKKNNVGDIIIVDGENKNKPIGIITDRDIITNVVAENKDYSDVFVSDVMSENLLILKSKEGIKEALEKMREESVRRAPIIDENENMIGIATFDELFILVADEISSLSQIIQNQLSS